MYEREHLYLSGRWVAPMLDFSLPFGGRKQSGIGREFGVEGLAENTEVKAIALPASTDATALA